MHSLPIRGVLKRKMLGIFVTLLPHSSGMNCARAKRSPPGASIRYVILLAVTYA